MFYSCFETPYSVIRTQVHPPLTLIKDAYTKLFIVICWHGKF